MILFWCFARYSPQVFIACQFSKNELVNLFTCNTCMGFLTFVPDTAAYAVMCRWLPLVATSVSAVTCVGGCHWPFWQELWKTSKNILYTFLHVVFPSYMFMFQGCQGSRGSETPPGFLGWTARREQTVCRVVEGSRVSVELMDWQGGSGRAASTVFPGCLVRETHYTNTWATRTHSIRTAIRTCNYLCKKWWTS